MKPAGKFQGMGRALGAGSQMVAATGVGIGRKLLSVAASYALFPKPLTAGHGLGALPPPHLACPEREKEIGVRRERKRGFKEVG